MYIVEIEGFSRVWKGIGGPLQDRKHYVRYVYYFASEEEVDRFKSKYLVSDISSLSPENRFVVESSAANQNTIMNDIKNLGDARVERSDRIRNHHETQHEIAEMKQEMAELRMLVHRLLDKLDANDGNPKNEQKP